MISLLKSLPRASPVSRSADGSQHESRQNYSRNKHMLEQVFVKKLTWYKITLTKQTRETKDPLVDNKTHTRTWLHQKKKYQISHDITSECLSHNLSYCQTENSVALTANPYPYRKKNGAT
jgi:hypothetical protein